MHSFKSRQAGQRFDKAVVFSGLLALVLTTSPAFAGTKDGTGGKGVVCNGKVATLDLYEARTKGIHPAELGSLESNLKYYGAELARHLEDRDRDWHSQAGSDYIHKWMNDEIISRFQSIPAGERLPLTKDAHVPALPSGCQEVQIAIYSDDGKIYRDADYWSQLEPVEQAALIVHEWVYHRARSYGVLNSDETRRVVGLIFSGRNPEPLLAPVWSSFPRLWCGAGNQGTAKEIYELYGANEVRNGVSGVAIYFRAFKSAYLTSRVSAFLPNLTMQEFVERKFAPIKVTATNPLMDRSWTMEINPTGDADMITIRAYSSGEQAPPPSNSLCKIE